MFESFQPFDLPFRHYFSNGSSIPSEVAADLVRMTKKSSLVRATGSRSDYKHRQFLSDHDYDGFSGNVQRFLDCLVSETFYKEAERSIGIDLRGGDIRAELVADVDGFFQTPHTDTSDKRITWLTYLGTSQENGDVGTDLYDSDHRCQKTATWGYNNGLIFVPGKNTWHGFPKDRKIKGTRKVLIINYVDGWEDDHQLFKPKC